MAGFSPPLRRVPRTESLSSKSFLHIFLRPNRWAGRASRGGDPASYRIVCPTPPPRRCANPDLEAFMRICGQDYAGLVKIPPDPALQIPLKRDGCGAKSRGILCMGSNIQNHSAITPPEQRGAPDRPAGAVSRHGSLLKGGRADFEMFNTVISSANRIKILPGP